MKGESRHTFVLERTQHNHLKKTTGYGSYDLILILQTPPTKKKRITLHLWETLMYIAVQLWFPFGRVIALLSGFISGSQNRS